MFSKLLAVTFCLSAVFAQTKTQDALRKEWCGRGNDCYEILEVTQLSTQREIKEKYNNFSLVLHPDKNPDQSESDKAKYVLINKAYEILGNPQMREEYDNYLKIKQRLDSPRESIILVIIILYALCVFVKYQYKIQRQKEAKKLLLQNNKIKKYFKDKGIDINTGKQTRIKISKKDKKSKKKKLNNTNNDESNEISNEDILECLKTLKLKAPGFEVNKPDWKTIAKELPFDIIWLINKIIYKINFRIKYQLLGNEMSEEDREYCCRKNFNFDEKEWNALSNNEKQVYLNRSGIWKVNKKKSSKKKN